MQAFSVQLIKKMIGLVFKVVGYFTCENLVYFESFHGKQFSDNPKAVYQEMKKSYPSYRLVWGVSKGHEEIFIKEEVDYVRRYSLKWLLTMPRAKGWVINTRTPIYMVKNKRTTYVQTWHGTPLKKLGLDISEVKIAGYDTASYREEFIKEAAVWDYLISPNSYCTDILPKAFGYQGQVLEVGYPRNDELVTKHADVKRINYLKSQLGIPLNKQVILYAPTWRETKKTNVTELTLDLAEIEKQFKGEVVFLVRTHYLVSETIDFTRFGETIMNVSNYPDMKELLLITDLLITDYSSSLFDFAITKRPMLFYMYDRLDYEEKIRGVYFDVTEGLPGKIVTTEVSLINHLRQFVNGEDTLISDNYEEFYQQFCLQEKGTASQAVIQKIIKKEE